MASRPSRTVLARGRRRLPALAVLLVCALALVDGPLRVPAVADDAQFEGRQGEEAFRPVRFPVEGGAAYSNDWHAPRSGGRKHLGNDLFAAKHTPLVAVRDARVAWMRVEDAGLAGRMLTLRDADGWSYRYIHLNNDRRGTDDGSAPPSLTVAEGVEPGARVRAGQVVAYVGDSGNAEDTASHVHFEVLGPDGRQVNPYPSLRLSQGHRVGNRCGFGSNPSSHPSDAGGRGYYLLDRMGGVFTFGDARFFGSVPGLAASGQRIGSSRSADLSVTPSGDGYWVLDEDGGVFTFGDARFFGSVPGLRQAGQEIGRSRVVALEPTPSGDGYWVLDEDGGVFTFGDARFFGSVPGLRQAGQEIGPATVVGMATNDAGDGYLVVDDRGGIFPFGAVDFHGSVPGTGLCDWAPVVDVAPTVTGAGYWMAGTDGRVWAFGDARYHGAGDVGTVRPAEVVALASTPS